MKNGRDKIRFFHFIVMSFGSTCCGQSMAQDALFREDQRLVIQAPIFVIEAPYAWQETAQFGPQSPPQLPASANETLSEVNLPAGHTLDIESYQAAIEELEAQYGAWSENLVEQLSGLGSLYHQAGDFTQAIAAYERALHVQRVNLGLNNTEQLDTIDQLIEINAVSGNWLEANRLEEYLFYTQLQAYGTGDQRLVAAMQRLADWQLEAFFLRVGSNIGLRLVKAQILYQAAADFLANEGQLQQQEQYIKLKQGVARSAFLIYTNKNIMIEAREQNIRRLQQLVYGQLKITNRRRGAYLQEYQEGSRALEDIASLMRENSGDPALATALVDLADWKLIFGRQNAATSLYEEAWQLLEPPQHQLQRDSLFAGPKPIPRFMATPGNFAATQVLVNQKKAMRPGTADVSFDVSTRGRARNVDLNTEQTSENSGHLLRIVHKVEGSHFRPLLIDGKIKSSRDHRFVYRYWY